MLEQREGRQAIDFLSTDRFLVRRRLGVGSLGAVYEAYDRNRGDLVALKVLGSIEPDLLDRFKKGFRRLAQLSHPNLVQLYELVKSDELWCYTTELLAGPDLVTLLRFGASGDPGSEGLDLGRVRQATVELLAGLAYLHGAGHVHADLKPSNVLADASGRIRLVDFGLARELSKDTPGAWWSPPAYAAPELGSPAGAVPASPLAVPGPAADLYSVGVMIYEALTGIRPGAGHERFPSERRPGVPADLDGLCNALLQPDPRDRPSAPAALASLGCPIAAVGALSVPSAVAGETRQPETSEAREIFVGRAVELAELGSAFASTGAGHGALLWIRGRSGMGKTALVERFLAQLEQEELGVAPLALRGRCHRQESVAFNAFDGLVDSLGRHLDELDAARLDRLTDRCASLLRLFPALRRVSALSRHWSRQGLADIAPEEVRRRAFDELRALLTTLAADAPVILFLDDLQWGDADSAALFDELVREPMPPYLVIACYRSEDFEWSPFLKGLSESALGLGGELVLGELSGDEAAYLARELLARPGAGAAAKMAAGVPAAAVDGLEPDHELRQEGVLDAGRLRRLVVDEIVREAQGSPFFVRALARSAARGGIVERGLSLHAIVARQVGELPEAARALLELLAIAARPLPVEVLHRAGSVLEGDAPTCVAVDLALRHAELEGLIRSSGAGREEVVEISHDRIRDALVRLLPEAERRQRHRELAGALEQWQEPAAAAAALAEHFRRTSDEPRAALYAVEAAEQAMEQLAFDRAARLLKLALDLGSSGLDPTELRTRLGDVLRLAGRGAEAAGEYLEAVRRGATERVVELQRRAAEQLLISGHVERGVRILRHVFRAVGIEMPRSGRRHRLAQLLRRAYLRLRGLDFRRRGESELEPSLLLRVDTYWSAAAGLRGVDPVGASELQARHLLLALRSGEPKRVARALALEVATSAASGTRTAAKTERLLSAATALAEELGDPESLGRAALAAVMAATGQGQWHRAVKIARQAAALFRERCSGVAWERRTNEDLLLQALNGVGDFREIGELVPPLLEEARDCDDRYGENLLGIWWARALLVADRPEDALRHLRNIQERWPGRHFPFPLLNARLVECEIGIYRRDPAALELLEECWRAAASTQVLAIQMVRIRLGALRARAALLRSAEASGLERKTLLQGALRNLRQIEAERAPWGDGLARLLRGSLRFAEGDSLGALEEFREAERIARASNTLTLAEVCRHRQGRLLGGFAGQELERSAGEQIALRGAAAPERLCDLFAPLPR